MAPRTTRRTATTNPSVPPPAASTSAAPASPPPAPRTRSKKPVVAKRSASTASPALPLDHLSPLSAELHALILEHLSPSDAPDLNSLCNYCRVSKTLLPHVQRHLYQTLRITTRTSAHALHRTLHGNDLNRSVKFIEADVGQCAKTSSQWIGWFLFHSMHSLCGIIGSCRTLLTLTLYLPDQSSAWTQSLCQSLLDLKYLHTLTKDLTPSEDVAGKRGVGKAEGMDVGWRSNKSWGMWSVSQFIKPLATLRSLHTLRICGLSSDSSTSPPTSQHSLRLTEVVLIEVNITNTDLLHILGHAKDLKKLTLWRSSLLSKRGLTHVLKRCNALVELRIGGSWFGAKDEDDTNFPLDTSMNQGHLPNLRILHVSGSLLSPALLLSPACNLSHLLVTSSPSFTPQGIHGALAKCRSDPPPVERLTLPEMGKDNGSWNEAWKFTVKATADAKGVKLEDGGGSGDGSDSGSD
ncbi:hypothetical protein MNV49_007282 [Pseudohyphozyma bogoriensis]|nr:hypothetical protein MNV49_007282 [Pseudohyphozyma bogoriensis]